MKKAILGVGIAWAIVCLITAAILIPIGILATDPQVIDQAVAQGGVTRAQAEEAAKILQLFCLIVGDWLVVAAAFSFVLVGIRNKGFGKGAGIALGVVGIVLGSEAPGILFIVDSAKNRN